MKFAYLTDHLVIIIFQKTDSGSSKDTLMMGALEEVKKLYINNYPQNSMIFKTIGVKEIKQYLDGLISLDEAIYLATIKTKQYAKKQATWFNNKFQDFTCIL